MKGYIKIRKKAIEMLENGLPDNLYYHGIHHTLDALRVSGHYLQADRVGPRSSKLLRIGVLFHDIGFTVSRKDHELESVRIAYASMSSLGFSKADIQVVEGLIWATKVPQSPNNDLQRIICDVDLDYLGRKDFYRISDQLYRELKVYREVESKEQWDLKQIKFLESHRYYTDFAMEKREPFKRKHLNELEQRIRSNGWEMVSKGIY